MSEVEPIPYMQAHVCGGCMNSSKFRFRVIVPTKGKCDWCDHVGTLWEIGGITRYPPQTSVEEKTNGD